MQSIEALDELHGGRRPVRGDASRSSAATSPSSRRRSRSAASCVDLRGRAGTYDGVYLPLYGDHQAQNAAVAVAAVESFLGDGTRALAQDVVVEGLGSVTSPGRLQLIGIEPTDPRGRRAQPARRLGAARRAHRVLRLRRVDVRDRRPRRQGRARHRGGARADRRALPRDAVDVGPRDRRGRAGGDRAARIARGRDVPVRHARARDASGRASGRSEAPRRAVVVTGSITLVGDAIQLAEREGWK